jgi:threonine synthase
MKFQSTKGIADKVIFSEALLRGLAPDGGLYVPEKLPTFSLDQFKDTSSFIEVAKIIVAKFFQDDVLQGREQEICERAFNFPIVLKQVDDGNFLLELFHGPTAAFKDVGASFLATCLSQVQMQLENKNDITILVATSGDTGGAVASAFYNQKGTRVILLYPKGKVSPRQEKQLTCWGRNIHSFAVDGTFDDCQRMVKDIFKDVAFSKRCRLSSANSINIGRILPQALYYAHSSIQYFNSRKSPANFIIPSGNMGNAVACFWAKEMNFPIGKVYLSCNANKPIPSFYDTLTVNSFETIATVANAMDVGNPSNIERLVDLFKGRLEELLQFSTARGFTDKQIKEAILYTSQQNGWDQIVCPHTATAVLLQKQFQDENWIIVSTAHAAKFENIVEPIINRTIPIPMLLEELLKKKMNYRLLDPNSQRLKQVIEELLSPTY